jgi:hypothetical protein
MGVRYGNGALMLDVLLGCRGFRSLARSMLLHGYCVNEKLTFIWLVFVRLVLYFIVGCPN